MKSELKAKFLQHLVSKKKDQGFTLIELLVVIIIIGILSAIALPSFLNQANKAKQSEAKTYIGTLNRTQQAYFLEKTAFASNLSAMADPVPSTTVNYAYASAGVGGGTAATTSALSTGTAQKDALRSYGGTVFVATNITTSETSTLAIAYESRTPSKAVPPAATIAGTTMTEPGGYDPLGK